MRIPRELFLATCIENDQKKNEISIKTLEHEVSRERQVFGVLKKELQIARNANAHKNGNFFERSETNEQNVAENKQDPATVALHLKYKRAPVTPSHWAPWRDISNEDPGMLVADRYRYALKKTLDTLWVVKIRKHDAERYYELLKAKEKQEIGNLQQLFNNMQSYLDHLADGISRMHVNRDLRPCHRADPLNTTIYNKLINDWTEIKELVNQYKPKEATWEHEKICKAVNDALYDLPVRYKPIYQLVMRIQNESYVGDDTKEDLARRGETIFGIPY